MVFSGADRVASVNVYISEMSCAVVRRYLHVVCVMACYSFSALTLLVGVTERASDL